MRSAAPPQRRAPNRAGLLLFVVLGGVLGMHALGSHGVAGTHTVGATAHHTATFPSSMGSGDQATSSPHGSMVAISSGVAPTGGRSFAMSLCVGVLAASVLLLLGRRARGLPAVGLAPRWLITARGSVTRCRDRDPPSLTLLSVRRC